MLPKYHKVNKGNVQCHIFALIKHDFGLNPL